MFRVPISLPDHEKACSIGAGATGRIDVYTGDIVPGPGPGNGTFNFARNGLGAFALLNGRAVGVADSYLGKPLLGPSKSSARHSLPSGL